jgi:hypothetical protein
VNILLETLPLPIERLALPVPSLVEGSTVEGPLEALPRLNLGQTPLLMARAQAACPTCLP